VGWGCGGFTRRHGTSGPCESFRTEKKEQEQSEVFGKKARLEPESKEKWTIVGPGGTMFISPKGTVRFLISQKICRTTSQGRKNKPGERTKKKQKKKTHQKKKKKNTHHTKTTLKNYPPPGLHSLCEGGGGKLG